MPGQVEGVGTGDGVEEEEEGLEEGEVLLLHRNMKSMSMSFTSNQILFS